MGLITTGFAYVMKNGIGLHGQIGIYRDDLVQGLKELVKCVKEYEAKIFIRLAHAGREILGLGLVTVYLDLHNIDRTETWK